MRLPEPPILVISDRRRCSQPLPQRADALFRGGCRWMSLRENDLAAADRLSLLQALCRVAEPFGATVSVHRDAEAARETRSGLHLPANGDAIAARARLAPDILLGQSCHGPFEIAAAGLVDYVTVSPIFTSASKPGYGPALGVAGLADCIAVAGRPVIALGGIGLDTIEALAGAVPAGIAIMGEAMTTEDPEGWFRTLAQAWRSIAGQGAHS